MKKDWHYKYDKETDSLFVGEYPMPEATKKVTINEDFSLYIDKNGNMKGIFIEYYKADLNKKLKEIAKKIFNHDKT